MASPEPTAADELEAFDEGVSRLVRRQLENLLRIVELEAGGAPVAPTAVSLQRRPTAPWGGGRRPHPPLHGDGYDATTAYRHCEPRLGMIERLLSRLCSWVRLEVDGDRLGPIDAFRLRDLAYWARYQAPRLLDNMGELSCFCSCDCDFCFVKGSRHHFLPRPMLTVAEARTRARYYSAERRRGLPTAATNPGEPLLNPHALELLTIARSAHPEDVLDITTNGDFLTEKALDALAALKPVHVALSLNARDPAIRRAVMRTHRPEVAVAALPLLRERELQFTGSVVAVPSIPVEEIAETVRTLDRHGPLQIRLLLPGYTRFAPPAVPWDTRARWDAIVELGARLRPEIRAPILIQPGFYWNRSIAATIDGVYPNSPADAAGLRCGDLIRAVNGTPVVAKVEATHLLSEPPAPGEPWIVTLVVQRGEQRFEVKLSNELPIDEDRYPYKPRGYAASFDILGRWHFGVELIDSFDIGALKALKELVAAHPGARRVLLFTTPLATGLLAQALSVVGDSPECRLDGVEVRATMAPQTYWGGNIVVGDLHVVDDYVQHLRGLQENGYAPDLAVIPSTFTSEWGFDLLGTSWHEIERRTGIPVALVAARRVMV